MERRNAEARTCQHCGTLNQVARCDECDREFVLTTAHVEGRLRQFADTGLSSSQGIDIFLCDFTRARQLGLVAEAVEAGLRQATCTVCHREFLSGSPGPN